MKRIGIMTIIDYNNYGNRVQNYALQELIKSLNANVETIINKPNTKYRGNSMGFLNQRLKKLTDLSFIDVKDRLYLKLRNIPNSKEIKQTKTNRNRKFIDFTRSNITETNIEITNENIKKIKIPNYDYIISGSDQIWNPKFRFGSSLDFLTFISPEKRVS